MKRVGSGCSRPPVNLATHQHGKRADVRGARPLSESRDGEECGRFQACGWMGRATSGGPWLALQLIKKLGFKILLDGLIPAGGARTCPGHAHVAGAGDLPAVRARAAELRIAEHLYEPLGPVGLARRRCRQDQRRPIVIARTGRAFAAQGRIGKTHQAATGRVVRPESTTCCCTT